METPNTLNHLGPTMPWVCSRPFFSFWSSSQKSPRRSIRARRMNRSGSLIPFSAPFDSHWLIPLILSSDSIPKGPIKSSLSLSRMMKWPPFLTINKSRALFMESRPPIFFSLTSWPLFSPAGKIGGNPKWKLSFLTHYWSVAGLSRFRKTDKLWSSWSWLKVKCINVFRANPSITVSDVEVYLFGTWY